MPIRYAASPTTPMVFHNHLKVCQALPNRQVDEMPMAMRDYSEKRDFHRMQVNSDIELTDGNGQTIRGVCRDLSGTGMQIYVEQFVAEGTEFSALLPSTSDDFPPLESSIRVLRSESEGSGFLLGTSITEIKR